MELIEEFLDKDGNRFVRMFDDREEELIYMIEVGANEITLVKCQKRTSYNFSSLFPLTSCYAVHAVYDKYITGLDEVGEYTVSGIVALVLSGADKDWSDI